MKQFIKDNRLEISQAIFKRVGYMKLNDNDRQEWVLNDENLYNWARSKGVRV